MLLVNTKLAYCVVVVVVVVDDLENVEVEIKFRLGEIAWHCCDIEDFCSEDDFFVHVSSPTHVVVMKSSSTMVYLSDIIELSTLGKHLFNSKACATAAEPLHDFEGYNLRMTYF